MMHSTFSLKHFVLIALSLGVTLSSCKKDDEETATPSNGGGGGSTPAAPSTTPNFSDADASLWAVNTFTSQVTPIGTFDIQVGVGVGAFTTDGFATMVNVGAVTLNTTPLTAQSNNAYVSTPSQTEPTGIDFGSGSTAWSVAGGSGFAGFDRTITSFNFPTVSAISSAETVVRSNGYTLTTPSVAGADSVLFLVGGVTKTIAGNANSCTFTASELGGLGTGANLVQVAAYRTTNEVIGGKNIYFGKETVRTKSVTIQ
ncbi:MAG: hypothetical protein KDB84_01030 [Flavobacteriales bacterium]|nr:hypothetical protein [Flavobacteriales bacterium]